MRTNVAPPAVAGRKARGWGWIGGRDVIRWSRSSLKGKCVGEREKAGGILLEVADMEQNDVLDVRFVGCKVRTKGSTSTLSLERGDEQ